MQACPKNVANKLKENLHVFGTFEGQQLSTHTTSPLLTPCSYHLYLVMSCVHVLFTHATYMSSYHVCITHTTLVFFMPCLCHLHHTHVTHIYPWGPYGMQGCTFMLSLQPLSMLLLCHPDDIHVAQHICHLYHICGTPITSLSLYYICITHSSSMSLTSYHVN